MPMPFEMAIEAHWREHRPRMVRALEQQGRLKDAVQRAAERHSRAVSAAIREGLRPWEAEELFREDWAFLPSEGSGGPEDLG